MKNSMTRILSLLLAITMLAGCAFTVLAANTGSNATDEIRVMIDGKDVSFQAAKPRIINGRTMVPFRAILESLGATVTYDAASKTVGAKLSDTSLSFQPGNAALLVKDADGDRSVTMDVLPYLDAKLGSTYVSARFVAEAFGFSVDWDAYERTVVVIDMQKLFSQLDEGFGILAKLNGEPLDVSKTYKMLMTMNMIMESTDSSASQKMVQNMTMSALMQGANTSASTDVTVTADDETISQKTDVLYDEKTYTFYFRSNAFKEMSVELPNGSVLDDKTWIRMTADDLTNMYAQMGLNIDFKELLSASDDEMSVSDALMMVFPNGIPMDRGTYNSISATISILKSLFGDEAFTKTTSGDITTYKTDSKNNAFTSIVESILPGLDCSYAISISEKAGKLCDYKLAFDVKNDDVSMSFGLTGTDANNAKATCTVNAADVKVSVDCTVSLTESNEEVVTLPGEDDVIIDFSDLINYSFSESIESSSAYQSFDKAFSTCHKAFSALNK